MPRTAMPGDVWSNQELLAKWEKERQKHRKKQDRLTFDCQFAMPQGRDRVVCSRGRILHSGSDDGGMYLIAVLRGRTSFQCKRCNWFQGEKEENDAKTV